MYEREIDVIELIKKLKNHIMFIILVTIIGGCLGFGISKFLITPNYNATTSMIVGNSNDSENNQDMNLDYTQIQANRALVSTYSEIVKSKGIAEKVINNLDLDLDYDEFSDKVSIHPVNDTQIISVEVIDSIPERAMDIANETSMIFKDSITEIMNVDNVQILDKATLPEEPYSPSILKNTFIGIILGLISGLAISMIRIISDRTIKSVEDVKEAFDIPVLGAVPDKKKVD